MSGDMGKPYVLDTPPDYNFDEALVYLSRSESECLHHVEGRTVYKALRLNGECVCMAVGMGEFVSGGEPGRVTVRFVGNEPDEETAQEAFAYVREWLDLDTELDPFYRMGDPDPVLSPVVDRNRGLRLIGVPSLFEALCWTVAGQQINLAFAYTLKKRLVEAFGTRLSIGGREWLLFPEVTRIAQLEPEDLQALKYTRSKSETLIRVARLLAEGSLSKEGLLGLGDFREAEKELTSVKGIGPWTANYVMMRCLRNPDAFPLTDVGLHNAIRKRLGRAEKPALKEIEELSARWAPWRAYATFYLWSSLAQD